MTGTASRREDILVSICFPDIGATQASVEAITAAAAAMQAAFRYWEIVVVAHAGDDAAFLRRCAQVTRNLRVITVRGGAGVYRKRRVAATEAIGDVVVMTTPREVASVDLARLAEAAAGERTAIVCTRDRSPSLDRLVTTLGAASGFSVSLRDMITAAFPRDVLNRLLAHPERELALRFPPRDEGFSYRRMTVTTPVETRRGRGGLVRRLALVYRLLVSSAPAVLTAVGLLSSLVAVAAFSYACYAVWVWFFIPHVQPGWFTTALVQSLTGLFLGFALFGISIAMQKILERLAPASENLVVDEFSNLDLFGGIEDLNVDIDAAPPVPVRATP